VRWKSRVWNFLPATWRVMCIIVAVWNHYDLSCFILRPHTKHRNVAFSTNSGYCYWRSWNSTRLLAGQMNRSGIMFLFTP
jgi:hypothetical protein